VFTGRVSVVRVSGDNGSINGLDIEKRVFRKNSLAVRLADGALIFSDDITYESHVALLTW
jgi:hypothetical protein